MPMRRLRPQHKRPFVMPELTSLGGVRPAVLMGVADIARVRGVARQRIDELTHHPAWPEPVPSISGRRWWSTDVAAFFAVDRRPGRPRKDGPGRTQRG